MKPYTEVATKPGPVSGRTIRRRTGNRLQPGIRPASSSSVDAAPATSGSTHGRPLQEGVLTVAVKFVLKGPSCQEVFEPLCDLPRRLRVGARSVDSHQSGNNLYGGHHHVPHLAGLATTVRGEQRPAR